MKNLLSAAVLFLLLSSAALAQVNWKFDKTHSNINFTVTHLVISEVDGSFTDFEGSVTSKAGDDFSDAKVNFSAKVASISTDNEQRDKHLRSDDFFNAEKYPALTFVGKSMKKTGKGKYKLTGDLTIRDVTKQVTLDVEFKGGIKDPWGNYKAGFKIAGSINRFDYNLKWNTLLETGGAVVGKDVKITCNVQLVKEADAKK